MTYPLPFLPPLPDQSRSALATILSVITIDEGGWVLSHLQGDSDGGWTFAGVTSSNLLSFIDEKFPASEISLVNLHDSLVKATPSDMVNWQDLVKQLYYEKYFLPAMTILKVDFNFVVEDYVSPAEVSAIINCGPGGFRSIVDATRKKGVDYNEKNFRDVWEDHYISICRADPSKLQFLQGWINRVRRYRDKVYLPGSK